MYNNKGIIQGIISMQGVKNVRNYPNSMVIHRENVPLPDIN